MAAAAPVTLACLEIWGGNKRAARQVNLPGLAGWVSVDPLPGSAAGGDVCYVSLCGAGQLSRVGVADVSGHGQSVSRVAERLRALMAKHISTYDQSEMVRELNESFQRLEPDAAAGFKFATVVLLGYLRDTGDFLLTNGGHPAPLRYRAAQGRWEYLEESERNADAANLPLGLIPGTAYRQLACRLDPGDLILVYSDGLPETPNATGERLEREGLLALAARLPVTAPEATGHALLAEIEKYRGGGAADDDLTIVVLQRPADWCPIA